MTGGKRGPRRHGGRLRARLEGWLRQHRRGLLDSLAKIRAALPAHLMSAAVLSIALALPAGLFLVVEAGQRLLGDWDGPQRISLYLTDDTTPADARALAAEIGQRSAVGRVEYVSREQALAEFRQHAGVEEALAVLETNPLPITLLVHPQGRTDGERLTALRDELAGLAAVDSAQLDMAWVERWAAIMAALERTIAVIALLLALAVVFVSGNTIRLEIENRREEILVTRLIGATDAYVRRPFLYSGALLGLAGGLGALLLLALAALATGPAIDHLLETYHLGPPPRFFSAGESLALLATATLLGWLGTWLTVQHHLVRLEPGRAGNSAGP